MSTREARGLAAAETEEEPSRAICSTIRISSNGISRCWRACACRMRAAAPPSRWSSGRSKCCARSTSALEQKLAEFVQVARSNDAIADRMHRFTRRLLRAGIARRRRCRTSKPACAQDFDAFNSVLLLIGSEATQCRRALPAHAAAGRSAPEVLRNAVRQRQAALRPGARFAARAAVRRRGERHRLRGARAAGRQGLARPARARQQRPRPLPSRA